MSLTTCSKCGKEFKRKYTYDFHINRKNPCTPFSDHINLVSESSDKSSSNKSKSKK